MAYSDFNLDRVRTAFGLTIDTKPMFADAQRVQPQTWLVDHFERIKGMPLNGEKVRGELLVSPLLIAVRESEGNQLGVFSGSRFDVDPTNGLVGECDFIVGLVESAYVIRAPVITMVEAKKADIESGLGQCIAQMIAARSFNIAAGANAPVFGCVTTGREWQFLKLADAIVECDRDTRLLVDLPLLLGIFRSIIAEGRAALAV